MTAMQSALNFSTERPDGDDRSRYGASRWALGLPDGREAYVYADRIEITDGVIVFWRDTIPAAEDGERVPANAQAMLALAPGTWVHVYAASVLDGSPVIVEYLPAPPRPQR